MPREWGVGEWSGDVARIDLRGGAYPALRGTPPTIRDSPVTQQERYVRAECFRHSAFPQPGA
jgi:hypothetical protein